MFHHWMPFSPLVSNEISIFRFLTQRLTELALPRLAGEDETGITDDVCEQLLEHAQRLTILDLSWNSLLTSRSVAFIERSCPNLEHLSISGFPLFCTPHLASPAREIVDAACLRLVQLCVLRLQTTLLMQAARMGWDYYTRIHGWLTWLDDNCGRHVRSPELLSR
jgi:hypothetical protein